MKKKIIALISAVLLLTLSLAACGGEPEKPEEKPGDGLVVYSESVSTLVVTDKHASEAVIAARSIVLDAINAKVEKGALVAFDVASPDKTKVEIAVGETSRAASAFANNYIEENFDGDGFAFVICYKDGAVAIAASDEESLAVACEYFAEKYITGVSLTVKENLFEYNEYTEEEYRDLLYGDKKAAELLNYENRWADIEKSLPSDVVKALKSYYSIYGTEIIDWFANLYDPETGAFYYSNSARDYEGFLPDIESTHQVLKDLVNAGCFKIYAEGSSEYPLVNALPKDMQEKIIAFVQDMQDPDDGYFYHKQWGKDIGTERRDRDLSWAIAIMGRFGAEFRYPTALDRLQDATKPSAAIAGMMSEVHPTASLPSYLQSREAFFAWLDTKDFKKDSHGNGHTVGSMSNQIEAAGLLDDAIEYFNALQTEVYEEMKEAYDADPENNPKPTGLWQKEVNYTSLSGLFKIGILYGDAGAPIQYADLAVESAIECILSDADPRTVIYAYNPWAGLGTALNSVKRANKAALAKGEVAPYDYDAIHAKVMENAAAMINKTTEKLLLFKQADGAFSYYQDYAAPTTQGTHVSLGVAEGDVNATTVAMDGASSIFGALGVSKPQLWTATDLDEFLDVISNSLPIEKIEMETDVTEDFEEYEDGEVPEFHNVKGDGVTGVTQDPENPDNKVFKFDYPGAQSTGYYYNITTNYREADAYLFEADYYMESASGGTTHQIQIQSGSKPVYMLTLGVSGGYVVVDDCATISNGNAKSDMGILVPMKTWFKLGIKLYNDGTAEGFKVKIYIDGVCKFISTNFYGSNEEGKAPVRGFAKIQHYTMRSPSSTLLVDNVHTNILDEKFDGSDLNQSGGEKKDSVTYDFESNAVGYTPLLNYQGSATEIVADPTGAGKGNVASFVKSNSDSGYTDDIQFASPADRSDKMTYSMDIYFDELSFSDLSYTAVYQVNFGGLGASCAYMMTLIYDKEGYVYIGDASSTGSGNNNPYKDAKISIGQWHNIKVVINMSTDPAAFSAEIYLDGNLVATSTNFYGSEKPDAKPVVSNGMVDIRVQRRVIYKAYIDNVVIDFSEK